MKLKLLMIKESSNVKILSSKDVAALMAEEAKADRECFWVLHLTTSGLLIEKELVSMGSLNTAIVEPREVFKKAILLGASRIITVHNHPGKQAEPSSDDLRVWKKLVKCGSILGIPVIDNLIVAPDKRLYSLQEDKPYDAELDIEHV